MAYEVAMERTAEIAEPADLFSWAAVAYLVFCGKTPFPGRAEAKGDSKCLKEMLAGEKEPLLIQKQIENFPPELDKIICGLMKKEVNDRPFKTAGELIKVFGKEWPKAVSKKVPPECDVIKTKLG
jgi:hypothetical protein